MTDHTHPRAIRVKPLVWDEPCKANNYTHIARSIFGDYYVHIDGGRHQAFLEAHVKPYENMIGVEVGCIYEAKAAAQADYDARIMAAIELTPDPRDAAIAQLVGAITDVTHGRGMFGLDAKADLEWAMANLASALAAAKAVMK